MKAPPIDNALRLDTSAERKWCKVYRKARYKEDTSPLMSRGDFADFPNRPIRLSRTNFTGGKVCSRPLSGSTAPACSASRACTHSSDRCFPWRPRRNAQSSLFAVRKSVCPGTFFINASPLSSAFCSSRTPLANFGLAAVLPQNLAEALLCDVVVPERPATVLADRRVRRLVRQIQPAKALVRDIAVDLFFQPRPRFDPVQISRLQ